MLPQKIFEKKDALRCILVHSKLRCEKLEGLSPPAFKSEGGNCPPALPSPTPLQIYITCTLLALQVVHTITAYSLLAFPQINKHVHITSCLVNCLAHNLFHFIGQSILKIFPPLVAHACICKWCLTLCGLSVGGKNMYACMNNQRTTSSLNKAGLNVIKSYAKSPTHAKYRLPTFYNTLHIMSTWHQQSNGDIFIQ